MYQEGICQESMLRKKLENFIKSRRVVEMRDLFEVVESTSRMTVFRRLSGVEYLCSYTHAGRYYTLFDIARFDSDGIWFYDDIGFSQNGSLKRPLPIWLIMVMGENFIQILKDN